MSEFSFAEWLDGEMKARKLSARELSRRSMVSQTCISHYRTGYRCPTILMANDILAAFGKQLAVVDKEKGSVPPIIGADHDSPAGGWWYVCPGCWTAIDYRDGFCRHCGRALYWEGIK